jgi:hypothetical protein
MTTMDTKIYMGNHSENNVYVQIIFRMVPHANGAPVVDKSRAWKVRTSETTGDQFLHFGEESEEKDGFPPTKVLKRIRGPRKRKLADEEAEERGQQESCAKVFHFYEL